MIFVKGRRISVFKESLMINLKVKQLLKGLETDIGNKINLISLKRLVYLLIWLSIRFLYKFGEMEFCLYQFRYCEEKLKIERAASSNWGLKIFKTKTFFLFFLFSTGVSKFKPVCYNEIVISNFPVKKTIFVLDFSGKMKVLSLAFFIFVDEFERFFLFLPFLINKK